jgi:hypothetical protein
MERDAILLVNLAQRTISADAARTIAAFLLTDFFDAAITRSGTDQRFILLLDEFHQYITVDAPDMLDMARNGGLHFVLAHQRMQQLQTDAGTQLRDSILANARIKVAFALDNFDTAVFMARQVLIEELNQDLVKDEISHPFTVGHEVLEIPTETRQEWGSHSNSIGQRLWGDEPTKSSYAGASDAGGWSVSYGTANLLKPVLEEQVASRTFYTLQEKESRLAERLMKLPRQECVIRVKNENAVQHRVADVEEFSYRDDIRSEYELQIYETSGALTHDAAKAYLNSSRNHFLQKVAQPPEKGKGDLGELKRNKKRPF